MTELQKLKSNFRIVSEMKTDFQEEYCEHYFIINKNFKISWLEKAGKATTNLIFVVNLRKVTSAKCVFNLDDAIKALKELMNEEKRNWAA